MNILKILGLEEKEIDYIENKIIEEVFRYAKKKYFYTLNGDDLRALGKSYSYI